MMFTVRWMALSILLSSISCFAQLNRGTITGTVTDVSGAVIPGVKVTIQNTATNFSVQTETTDAGQYHRPGLQSGPYQITFEAPSFKRLVRSGFTLSVTDVLRVDVQ